MPGPSLIASSRAAYTTVGKTLTFPIPAAAQKGDVLLAVAVHDTADTATAPATWTLLDTSGSGTLAEIYAHMVGDNEPSALVLSVDVSHEWQGELLVLRGGAAAVAREVSAAAAFVATATPAAPTVTSQQAVSLRLGVWSTAAAVALTSPTGFTLIDTFNTAVVAARSLLVAYRIAGATGALGAVNAAAAPAATGEAFSYVLRAGPAIVPVTLFDVVPGNVGLIP